MPGIECLGWAELQCVERLLRGLVESASHQLVNALLQRDMVEHEVDWRKRRAGELARQFAADPLPGGGGSGR